MSTWSPTTCAHAPAASVPPAEPPPERWTHPDIGVARSPIAGTGLVAVAPVKAGTALVRFVTPPASVDLLGPINHSCDPTLWWADGCTLVARRDVAAGEELTSDYATSSIPDDFVMMCHCETYRCRQLIAGDDWRIPQLQARYAGHWVPSLQRLIDAGLRRR